MLQLRAYLTTYHSFSADEWQRIDTAFGSKMYRKGEFLLQAGQTDRHIWFVEQGVVRVYEESEDGVEHTFYFVSSGQFAADVESFNHHQPTVYNIQAVTDCQTWAISYDGFQQLAEQIPDWTPTIQRITERVLLEKVHKRSRLLYEDAKTRYRRLLIEQPEVAQQVPLGMIASYLGITLPSLSRLRKQLSVEHA
ncbi:Crp/Fnr family transcriptional regulator [Spirosoma arcticum]